MSPSSPAKLCFRQAEVPEVLLDKIQASQRILVQGHIRPDGDAVAASLGLGLSLEKLGKTVHICLVDGVPDRFLFLPEIDRISQDPKEGGPYDLAILCDTAAYPRAGYPIVEESLAPFLVNIDHHPTNDDYADLNWVHEVSSSTAEMVLQLIETLEVPPDKTVGTILMNGIATDTGFLKFPSATANTIRAVARLVDAGVDHSALYRHLFEDIHLGVQKISGRALTRITTELEGRLLWTWMEKQDGLDCSVPNGLASIGVGPLCPIQGAQLLACFEDLGDGKTIVELRSRNHLPVDKIAVAQGGGGHSKASGFTFTGTRHEAQSAILPLLKELIEA